MSYTPHTVWAFPVFTDGVLSPTASGRLETDAKRFITCTRCGAGIGQPCISRFTQEETNPHIERTRAVKAMFPHITYKHVQADRANKPIRRKVAHA